MGIEGNFFWNHIAYVADENESNFTSTAKN